MACRVGPSASLRRTGPSRGSAASGRLTGGRLRPRMLAVRRRRRACCVCVTIESESGIRVRHTSQASVTTLNLTCACLPFSRIGRPSMHPWTRQQSPFAVIASPLSRRRYQPRRRILSTALLARLGPEYDGGLGEVGVRRRGRPA